MVPSPPCERRHFHSRRAEPGLFERSTAARTFGSLGVFLVLIFLGAGVYLIQQALANPISAEAASVLLGAFILALAVIMLALLFTSRRKSLMTATGHIREAQNQPAGSPGAIQRCAGPTVSGPAQPELRRN